MHVSAVTASLRRAGLRRRPRPTGTGPAGAPGAPAVAYIGSHARLGGSERHLERLLAHADPRGICTIALLEDGPSAAALRAAGFDVHVIPTGAGPLQIVASAVRLRRILGRARAEVVHASGTKAALASVLATAAAGIPVVWVKHDHGYRRLGRLIARRCTLVVGVSRSVVASLVDLVPHRVRVVPTGTPDVAFDRDASRRLLEGLLPGGPPGPVVGLVGRLDPAKGHEELLAVLPELVRDHPGTRVAFVGGDDPNVPGYRASLEEHIRKLGVAHDVVLLGHRPDVPELLAGMDVVVVPSLAGGAGSGGEAEGFPLVALEALQAGTPVVAYATGGVPELLGDCGVLVPPGDRPALLAALDGLLADEPLRARLAACGRRRVAERFGLARMVEEFAACYRQAAGDG